MRDFVAKICEHIYSLRLIKKSWGWIFRQALQGKKIPLAVLAVRHGSCGHGPEFEGFSAVGEAVVASS